MPFCLDNDAFICWRDGKPWDFDAWLAMLRYVRMTGLTPMWATVPDVVANRQATLDNWPRYRDHILSLGWVTAFCVQDGMTTKDVPADAQVIFVGGTDDWKFPNLEMWTSSFPRVHCARVNAPEMFEACERLGCESIDGTGWFRDPSRDDKLPAVERFIEGHRNGTPPLPWGDDPKTGVGIHPRLIKIGYQRFPLSGVGEAFDPSGGSGQRISSPTP